MTSELRRVRANHLDIAYFEYGEGPLVVLVHGFPDTAMTWQALGPRIADLGYRVVAPYLRGYHPTSQPDRDTTIVDLGDDVRGLMDALDAPQAVLVGHDWGASAVMMAAATAPERVVGLGLLAIPHPAALTPSLTSLWRARHFITLTLPGAERRFARRDLSGIDTLLRRWAPNWTPSEDELADVRRCFREPGALHAALGYYRAFSFRVPDRLKAKLPMPTVAIAGLEDIVEVTAFERSRRGFSGDFQVREYPCGHFPHRERPDDVFQALSELLSKSKFD
ncbi:MAG: alpha/beta hydrolase [Myxococcota bacterium]